MGPTKISKTSRDERLKISLRTQGFCAPLLGQAKLPGGICYQWPHRHILMYKKNIKRTSSESGVKPTMLRELDVMRVWFLRAFVVFFLDFVMFSQSFHGYSLDMFLCSCFLNKTNFSCLKNLWIQLYPSLPISILIVSKVALFGLLPPHSL